MCVGPNPTSTPTIANVSASTGTVNFGVYLLEMSEMRVLYRGEDESINKWANKAVIVVFLTQPVTLTKRKRPLSPTMSPIVP